MNNELGYYLKGLRGEKSLREVAEKCGISHTYLDTLEKGYDPRTKKERKPNPDVLEKLANYYSVDYEHLMYLAKYIDEDVYNAITSKNGLKNRIKHLLTKLTNIKGYFLPFLRKDIFESINLILNMDPGDVIDYRELKGYDKSEFFQDYFSNSPDEYAKYEHEDIVEAFNKAFNIMTIMEKLDSNYIHIDKLQDFLVSLQQIIVKHNINIEKENIYGESELNDFINKPNIFYKKNPISDNDKKLITAYLDDFFTNKINNDK